MALNRKTFKKAAAAVADTNLPSGYFNTVLYEGNGGTQRIGGYINRGAVFNGSSSYITLPTGSPFNDSNTIKSVSAWVKLNSTSDRVYPFSVSSTTVANDFFNFGYLGDSNNILLSIRDGSSSNQVSHSVSVTIDTNWHHIVAQTTGNSVEIYLDGVSQTITSTYSGTGSSGSWISYPSYGGSVVGNIGINRKLSSVFSNGKIDQVRFFNKALSSGEVTTLYGETHASTTIETTDIFNDNSGVALYQLDGNANDTGGVSGKFGAAAIFNGSSSKIQLPSGVSVATGNNDFTLSTWVYLNNMPSNFASVITTQNNFYFYILIASDGSVKTYNQNVEVNSAASVITTGQWYNIVATLDSTNGKNVYVNGSNVATSSDTSNCNSLTGGHNAVGYYTTDGSTLQYYLDGKIDQVRIYSSVLSSSDVTNLYNESSVPTANLVAHYKLDGDARDEQQLYDGAATNVTYAYDGTATNVTYQEATNFSPDLVWVKHRNHPTAHSHNLADSVRGATKLLYSNTTDAEETITNSITSFDSNGFTIGNSAAVNGSPYNYAAWCFNAGTDAAASNTDGVTSGSVTAVTSTVKADTEAGFSICEFTTPSSGKPSWGHGLSQAPELIIVKNAENTGSWFIWSPSILGQKELRLNTTAAATSYSPDFISADSSKIDLGSGSFNIGVSSRHINYNFHSVDGIQKVGSYTSDGSDGDVFVETNFEPAFLMIKNAGSAHDWVIFDNKRDTANLRDSKLSPNTSGAEYSATSIGVDFTSDGFVIRGTDDAINDATDTFIYLAIAADPDTTTPTVENSFDVVTYTGNGGTQSIDVDFKPDLVWIKNRNNSSNSTHDHSLFDSIRGNYRVRSNSTGAENDYSSHFGGIDANGFTVTSGLALNDTSGTYVAWCWKAGSHDDNLPQINTEGSIDSVVSVNDAAGFSIVKYTGNGTTGATVGHGMSSTPQMMISKRTDTADNWNVYTEPTGNTGILYLNLSDAFTTVSNRFNNTSPTSEVFTLGNSVSINANGGEYIAYCFTSISGYQEVGSYSGTGATTNKITTGFKPRFLLVKQTNTTRNWYIIDSTRNPSDPRNLLLIPNDSATEFAGSGDVYCDFLSDGFEWTSSAGDAVNQSGGTYIYLAIA